MAEHILFLTGKLAERGLARVLHALQPTEFTYEIRDLGLSVAALMTADMIERRVKNAGAATRVVVPGLCAGDLTAPAQRLGIPVERGPEDLKDLPGFFGKGPHRPDLSRYDIQIFAEVVDAPHLSVPAILERAAAYRVDGADVIDLGCLPGLNFPHLEEAVIALREQGVRVSVDSLDESELLRGGKAGADYLLSLKESSLWIADEVPSIPVLIPETAGDMASLYRAIDTLTAQARPFIADSILDPIHFGVTDSIVRYHELRRRYPTIEIMVGTGNLTELTDADTAGMNALMLGILSELGVQHLLSTQVSPHACRVVRELDAGRRIMFAAREDNRLPRGYDPALLVAHDRRPFPYADAEIAEMAEQIRDPSYRIQVSESGLHVYNRDGLWCAQDAFALFPQLKRLEADAPHAFYMGAELARAEIAWQLGKRYTQDEGLDWRSGARTRPVKRDHDAHAFKPEGTTRKASKKKGR